MEYQIETRILVLYQLITFSEIKIILQHLRRVCLKVNILKPVWAYIISYVPITPFTIMLEEGLLFF